MFTEAVEGRRMTSALFASFKIRRVYLLLSEAIDDLFSCFSKWSSHYRNVITVSMLNANATHKIGGEGMTVEV